MNVIPDRYEPCGHAMTGGMGSVVVCTDKVLERHVAIKFIKSAANKHRMNDEVAALLKLRSKHVVQVYDVLRVGPEEVGIVQEFINGKDLFESYGAPSSVTDYYRQLWQIASGIADIHELGVIHRDIKPNNMKTDHEGVIKIFDFGLARDDGPNAATKCFVGTPGFAAPELYKKPFVFTPAVDTYAFGVTALYLATGTLPPELREAPPSIDIAGYFTALDFTIAPEIAEILDACIQECPLDRPTMREVRDNLARHLLFDKHRALVVYQGEASVLSSASREVNLAFGGIGSVSIRYNGLNFLVENVSGEVHINNQALAAGSALPGACVVALGAAHRRPNERRFITFDISHPEIVL